MKQKFLRIIAILMFVAGMLFCLYPIYGKLKRQNESKSEVENFIENVVVVEDNGMLPEGYIRLFSDFKYYNNKIYEQGQVELMDPFDYQNVSFDLQSYGLESEVIGTIWIPRMNVELPMYLGANYTNMDRGVAILGQTSMPVGGNNTNTVIAGHRGWSGAPMFRDIQSMQIGDKIEIKTAWDTLIYRVCELKIILAGDVDEILIQEDRELITLLTCHPFTKNTHRYLVFAERTDEAPTEREEDIEEAEETFSEEAKNVTFVDEEGIAWEEQVEGLEYSELQIWLDDYGVPIIFGVMLGVMTILLIFRKKR